MNKIFLLLVCLSSLFFVPGKAYAQQSTKIAVKGIADLRGTDLRNKIALTGEWAFAWKKLLAPEHTKSMPGFIDFPSTWNGTTASGEVLSSQGFATYRLQVLLPKNRESLALNIPDFYSSYRLYVNGKLFSAAGRPDSFAKNYAPGWNNKTVAIDLLPDTLELVLQVANFSHAKGGIKKPVTIGNNELMQSSRERAIAADFLLSGCLFMGGLFFFGLYVFGKNDKATLFFSLFCMLYSYRIVGSGSYALLSVFPEFIWQLSLRLEYFTLFGSILLFIQYVWKIYPSDVHKPIMKGLTVCCSLLTVTPLLLPPIAFTQTINPFLVLMFFCIVYALFVFIKACNRKRAGAVYALSSVAVLMLVMLLINLEFFNIIVPSGKIIFAGYIAFFFLQSLVLSHRFSYAMQKAQLQAEEGLKAKSEFLATMSHEIRTPLNSVIGLTHLMLKNDPRKDQKEQLDVLRFSADNLLSIVNNILDYSKIEAGQVNFEHIEMDIAHILRNVVSAFDNAAADKGIALKLALPAGFNGRVISDPTRFTQVVSNITGNAIKFTNRGEVMIGLTVINENENELTVKISIKDTGIGISKEKQRHIFEQFTQEDSSTSRSYGGTGLGLAISKRILELQGAQLQLESDQGSGALFYFSQTFVRAKKPGKPLAEQPAVSGASMSNTLNGMGILLVEDNTMNVFVAKSFLQSWGAVIDIAENGVEALNKLDTTRHKVVLMDLHMPLMDGYEATRRIRAQGITVPIIALTASLPNEIAEEVKGLEVDNILLKPFVPTDLYKAVVQYALVDH